MSRLVVMGSGETAPTMVRVHREVFAACPPGPAVMLDTPFAFQMNRAELVTKTRAYFAQSVGREVDVAAWSGTEGPAQEEKSLALLDRAAWAFAGPGSPTYALAAVARHPRPGRAGRRRAPRRHPRARQRGRRSPSAATRCRSTRSTRSARTRSWVDGLDLLGELTGVAAAVVPHYDNKEGATHDTRFCYLGEQRLAPLEATLPDEVGVLGVDEHTAMVVDVEARTMSVRRQRRGQRAATRRHPDVRGRGVARARRAVGDAARRAGRRGRSGAPAVVRPTTAGGAGRRRAEPGAVPAGRGRPGPDRLRGGPRRARRRRLRRRGARPRAGDRRLAGRHPAERRRRRGPPGAAGAGRAARRAGRARRRPTRPAASRRSSRRCSTCGGRPGTARTSRTSDLVRDRLVAAGVEVRDTPDGTEWTLSS